MAPRGILTVTAVLCFILGLLSQAPIVRGDRGRGCCPSYHRKPIPINRIKGYREQLAVENCRIDAIIFYTVRRAEICATRKDAWVRKTLDLLSLKLKNMSKAGPAAGEIQMRKSVTPSFNGGSGSFFSTKETFQNSTESFY
ncbi:C-C motif chemokine 17-like [Symphorus nematophorus]